MSKFNVVPLSPRGFSPSYHMGAVNFCPGCNRTNWIVRRTTAECGFCHTALPIDDAQPVGSSVIVARQRHSESAFRGRFTVNGKAA